jgi:hypothetical protein
MTYLPAKFPSLRSYQQGHDSTMRKLRQIVASQTALAEELPLVHTTRCEVLPRIVAKHELRSLTACDVFHEHLIYFFYGRPAYRYALGRDPGGALELCPVCFVFKPYTVGGVAKRVFACDSGAIHNGYFLPHLSPADRDEMQLDSSLESARRLVPLVFGSNDRYFLGSAQSAAPASFSAGSPAQRFHALLMDQGPLGADDRRSAIEVQLQSPVLLDHHLLYVVLPAEVLNRSEVRQAILEIWQCDPIGYDIYPGAPPHDYTATIRDTIRRRFKEGQRL